jgi:hypothetical protein
LGLRKDYKNLSDWLEENLIPEKKAEFYKADAQCYDSNWADFTGKKIGSYLKKGHKSLYEAIPSSIFTHTGLSCESALKPYLIKSRSDGMDRNSKSSNVHI